MKTPYKSHVLLDTVIASHHLRNDAHLADEIGISRSRISVIRNVHPKVSEEFRVLLMRRFGMSLKEIDKLNPPEAKP